MTVSPVTCMIRGQVFQSLLLYKLPGPSKIYITHTNVLPPPPPKISAKLACKQPSNHPQCEATQMKAGFFSIPQKVPINKSVLYLKVSCSF